MAETYTFGDHMFQTNEGPSFPAHQYLLSGTSRVSTTSTISVAENPEGSGNDAGCLAPPGSTNNTLDISNPSPETTEGVVNFPLCFEHPTLTTCWMPPVSAGNITRPCPALSGRRRMRSSTCASLIPRMESTTTRCATDPTGPTLNRSCDRRVECTDHQRYQWRSTCFRELGHPTGSASDHPATPKTQGHHGYRPL